jgi:hypothetical protein
MGKSLLSDTLTLDRRPADRSMQPPAGSAGPTAAGLPRGPPGRDDESDPRTAGAGEGKEPEQTGTQIQERKQE